MSKKLKLPTRINDRNLLAKLSKIKNVSKVCTDAEFKNWQAKHNCRPDDLVSTNPISHNIKEFNDKLSVTVEIRACEQDNFKFRITSNDSDMLFSFFRFDSKGLAHRNKNKPMDSCQITCPHFHSYDEDGYSIAYKTDFINNTPELVKDCHRTLGHFFEEYNITHDYPVKFEGIQTSMPSNNNPLEGITF